MAYQIIDANTTIGAHPNHRLNMSAERLIKEMDGYKIAGSLVQSTQGIYYSYERGNCTVMEAAKSSNRLVPVGSINPLRYFGSDEDIKAICTAGFKIFKFYPNEQNWKTESASFIKILKQLAQYKPAIMIDVPYVGQPTEAIRAAEGYPGYVILCSISLDTLSESIALMTEYPNTMIETHELHVSGAPELISEKVGSDRLIYGSGTPLRSIASSLSYIMHSGLSDEQKQQILGGNIRRVLEAGK